MNIGKQKFFSLLVLAGFLFSMECAQAQVEVENAFPNLSFARPVDLQYPSDETNRLFVVEQQGIIQVFENNPNTMEKTVFLDIRDRVNDSGNEQGLLGLAFHPDYQNNGYFYVDYTASNPDRTVIARYEVSEANPDAAVKDSESILLEVAQPFSNHNAGQIVFGPDGYLYITFGDGGSGGDPQGNGQNLETLLGTIVRIDVDQTQGELNYAIPSDNPFVANLRGFRDEIYAYGLRNPWRISFDAETGWLWAADVGQNAYEEINVIESGKNYGWNIMEGFHCYNAANCDTMDLTLPIWEYSHSVGQSITGGFVYRGNSLPDLVGKYVYADYVSGRIWALEYDGTSEPSNTLLLNSSLNVAAFGVDRNNELYLCAFNGSIYQFKSATNADFSQDDNGPTHFQLAQNYPNPFNATTAIRYNLARDAHVSLDIYNAVGELISTVVRGVQSAGEQIVTWSGRDKNGISVESGVYLYQLTVNGSKSTRKMLVIK